MKCGPAFQLSQHIEMLYQTKVSSLHPKCRFQTENVHICRIQVLCKSIAVNRVNFNFYSCLGVKIICPKDLDY